jgi:hypothetical protein
MQSKLVVLGLFWHLPVRASLGRFTAFFKVLGRLVSSKESGRSWRRGVGGSLDERTPESSTTARAHPKTELAPLDVRLSEPGKTCVATSRKMP